MPLPACAETTAGNATHNSAPSQNFMMFLQDVEMVWACVWSG
jgi:hypothetical protein